jgi:hypothetical protein
MRRTRRPMPRVDLPTRVARIMVLHPDHKPFLLAIFLKSLEMISWVIRIKTETHLWMVTTLLRGQKLLLSSCSWSKKAWRIAHVLLFGTKLQTTEVAREVKRFCYSENMIKNNIEQMLEDASTQDIDSSWWHHARIWGNNGRFYTR